MLTRSDPPFLDLHSRHQPCRQLRLPAHLMRPLIQPPLPWAPHRALWTSKSYRSPVWQLVRHASRALLTMTTPVVQLARHAIWAVCLVTMDDDTVTTSLPRLWQLARRHATRCPEKLATSHALSRHAQLTAGHAQAAHTKLDHVHAWGLLLDPTRVDRRAAVMTTHVARATTTAPPRTPAARPPME